MFRYDIAQMLSDQLTTGWRENDTSVQSHVYEYRSTISSWFQSVYITLRGYSESWLYRPFLRGSSESVILMLLYM